MSSDRFSTASAAANKHTGKPPTISRAAGRLPDSYSIEEVSNAAEARNLAEFYREIIESVEEQMKTANGGE